jgi:L,D-peptidoglycan transpeptidase YkuD (ErfK/YbiS/YcfS/YnhG family)
MNTALTLFLCTVLITGHSYPCSIGKNGITVTKREGDNATPAGEFALRQVFYRADRLSPDELMTLNKLKEQGFSVQALTQDDGWCDDSASAFYNQYIQLSSFKTGEIPHHENLWRKDNRYDIVVVMGYNDDPVIPGKGSAIFMHIAGQTPQGNYQPTAGCVAFSKGDLLQVLESVTPTTKITIPAKGKVITL